MLRLIRNLIVVLALVVGVAFGFFNYNLTSVDLLWTTTQAPLVVLLALAALIGFLVAFIVFGTRITRLRRNLSRTRRELKDAQAEIANLRRMPVRDL